MRHVGHSGTFSVFRFDQLLPRHSLRKATVPHGRPTDVRLFRSAWKLYDTAVIKLYGRLSCRRLLRRAPVSRRCSFQTRDRTPAAVLQQLRPRVLFWGHRRYGAPQHPIGRAALSCAYSCRAVLRRIASCDGEGTLDDPPRRCKANRAPRFFGRSFYFLRFSPANQRIDRLLFRCARAF